MDQTQWYRQRIVWQLNNFTRETISKYNRGNPVKSEFFPSKNYDFKQSRFELYPEDGDLVLRIVIDDGGYAKLSDELSLKVIGEMGPFVKTKAIEKNYTKISEIHIKEGCFRLLKMADIPKKDKLFKTYEQTLRLVINFELCTYADWNAPGYYQIGDEKYNENTVADAIGSLFNEQDFSDVKIICCDGIELPAHRVVLATRSPVFKAMLTMEMAEKKTSTITISDIDGETMEHILLFLYKGLNCSLTELENDLASKLMYAAEKYDLPALKEICAKNLNINIVVENVISTLLIAEKFRQKNLKDACLRFIATNFTQLQDTDEWELLGNALLTELMKVMKEMEDKTIALVNTL